VRRESCRYFSSLLVFVFDLNKTSDKAEHSLGVRAPRGRTREVGGPPLPPPQRVKPVIRGCTNPETEPVWIWGTSEQVRQHGTGALNAELPHLLPTGSKVGGGKSIKKTPSWSDLTSPSRPWQGSFAAQTECIDLHKTFGKNFNL